MPTGLQNAHSLYVEAIERGDFARAIETYAGERYVQHSHPVPDGKEGFKEFFASFVERQPDRRMDIVRSFQDGQYVFLHVVQILGGTPTWVTMDIFDTDEDGRLVEHWDIISAWREDTASGRSMVDGPTGATDLHQTEANKNLVRRFIEDVLIGGNDDAVADYVSTERYHQHNPAIADGLDGLGAFLAGFAEQGLALRYHSTRLLVGHGDLVAALSHADVGGVDSAVLDLFRVEDGLLVEHWDSIEEILPPDQWVNSGKF